MYKKLSLIIPVYNEELTLQTVLNNILETDFGIAKELIIINDASTDKTLDILKQFEENEQIKIITNAQNIGKSRSVQTGIAHSKGDLVVIHDADLEYTTSDLIEFIKVFNTTDVDVIYGNRFAKNFKIVYPIIYIGNIFLSSISGLITGLRAKMWIRDSHVCYKMVKGDIMREISKQITSTSGFGFDTEVTVRLSKYLTNNKHLKLAQIPVSYTPRTMGQGKKLRPISDGLQALWEIIKYNFFSK